MPGSDFVGSATALCEFQGISQDEVAAGQGDRGGVGSGQVAVSAEVPLAKFDHLAPADEAVQIWDECTGDASFGTPVLHLFCGGLSASTDWGPIMFPQTAPVAQDAMPGSR